MSYKNQIDCSVLPKHVAIIMDGNGRWAKEKGMERYKGHIEGVESVRSIAETAAELGIRYLTLYTFSTENWNRPKEEVDALMSLLITQIERESPTFKKNNISLRAIGDLSRLPIPVRERLENCMRETASHTGMTLILALSYSSRWEITNAAKEIALQVKEGTLNVEAIDEATFSAHLSTSEIPDPDLLIRTGKEYRISNYLLWQAAYTELFFPDLYWPDFRAEDFYKIICDYQKRERRFGKTSEQI
ncbi:MAG: isoprenyl transferase [Bacteroidales bacterium]|nr:isoprenyl transferase [Bacteroidales bacterium]MDD4821370.1 isoprenyl transferase [Bacteroidales bacterium]